MAMYMYPEDPEEVQAEMDALVGCDGLPDLDSAPFINAVVKKTFR
jgi:hypothetical protein